MYIKFMFKLNKFKVILSLKDRVNQRAELWKSDLPINIRTYQFDSEIPYPFGAKDDSSPTADIV